MLALEAKLLAMTKTVALQTALLKQSLAKVGQKLTYATMPTKTHSYNCLKKKKRRPQKGTVITRQLSMTIMIIRQKCHHKNKIK